MEISRQNEIARILLKRDLAEKCNLPAFSANLPNVLKNSAIDAGVSPQEAVEFAIIITDEIRAEEIARIDDGAGLFTYIKTPV